ncbi:MAG: hypothetical protein SPK65_01670 [Succinivibrio dextrinosolvens]|nr:hypothetical protein [Succinivibrio dextrinosolvens]
MLDDWHRNKRRPPAVLAKKNISLGGPEEWVVIKTAHERYDLQEKVIQMEWC